VSLPACFSARIASAVSLMFPQWSELSLDSNSSTQSSKILSGVAKIVSAISSVDNPSQSSAFSSRQSNPSSTLSESCCGLVDDESDVVVVSSVSSNTHTPSSQISPVSQSPKDWQSSPTAANAGATENSNKNKTMNTPTFFMYR